MGAAAAGAVVFLTFGNGESDEVSER